MNKKLLPFALQLGMVLLTVTLGTCSIFLGQIQLSELSLPRVFWGEERLLFQTKEQIEKLFTENVERFLNTPMSVVWRGEVQKFLPRDIGLSIDAKKTLAQFTFKHSANNARFLRDLLKPQYVVISASFNDVVFEKKVSQTFSHFIPVQNAHFDFVSKTKSIIGVEEKKGFIFDRARAGSHVMQALQSLKPAPLFLKSEEKNPAVTLVDLEASREELLKKIPQKISLTYKKQSWDFNFPQDIKLISFDYFTPDGKPAAPALTPYFEKKTLVEILEDRKIFDSIQKPTENVRIFFDEKEKIQFEGKPETGRFVDETALLAVLNATIAGSGDEQQAASIKEIPFIDEEPEIIIDEKLRELGVKELVSVGFTTYYSSPVNRMHNIAVGVSKFNGTLIPPGGVFSFNDHLGRVDASTGYRKELVIKPDGTKPEFGGGLCQVSTTLYRAALNAGFPIVQRKPHSYAVTYYSQVGGHGLDATIYPPAVDMQFRNDTEGHILIQSYVEGASATFNFYGTKDDRVVTLEGPYIGNHRSAPPDEIIYTTEIPLGERRKEENAHNGFDATWYRVIRKGGEETRETIFSRYKAIPAKILVGGEAPADQKEKIDTEVEAARALE